MTSHSQIISRFYRLQEISYKKWKHPILLQKMAFQYKQATAHNIVFSFTTKYKPIDPTFHVDIAHLLVIISLILSFHLKTIIFSTSKK
jgi:hypothetical protein